MLVMFMLSLPEQNSLTFYHDKSHALVNLYSRALLSSFNLQHVAPLDLLYPYCTLTIITENSS